MSLHVEIDDLTDETRSQIAKDLEFFPREKQSWGPKSYASPPPPKGVSAFHFTGDGRLSLPLNYALSKGCVRRPRSAYPPAAYGFTGKLRPLQKEVRAEAVRQLNKTGSSILSLFCGAGKTITAINIASRVKLRTLVVVTRLVLMDQWKSSIERFSPAAVVQKLTAKSKIKDADFYIMNAINVPKLHPGALDGVGLLIVDELHLIGTEKLSAALFHVTPRYALGLSATPTRPDGMELLLYAFFGSHCIHRKLFREHIVYRIPTGLKPPNLKQANGKTDWNAVLEFQATHDGRGDLVRDIIQAHPERWFLVLCKRVAHAHLIVAKLSEIGIIAETLIGSQRVFDEKNRVLVATVQKAGVGFDHPKLDALIVAGDMKEYFLQYLGRVFRVEKTVPIVFDLVDNSSTLQAHYRSRKQVYIEHGGTIHKLHPEKLRPDKLHPERLRPDKLHPERLRPDKLHPERLRPDKLHPERLLICPSNRT